MTKTINKSNKHIYFQQIVTLLHIETSCFNMFNFYKTEKHLAVFLNIIYENDADKDLFAALSDKVISISNKLLRDHVLQYHSVEDSDLEFIYNLVYLIKVSLNSGGFVNLTNISEVQ